LTSRQREHLERSVASLRKKLSKDTEIHRADNVRIMQENVMLIKGYKQAGPYGMGNPRGVEWGEFHDQGDVEFIVIRGQLRGYNDTPLGQSTPGRPIGHPGVGRPSGVFGGLSYYQLVI
jgi:hypothetical protein